MIYTLEIGPNLRYVLLWGAALAAASYVVVQWWIVGTVRRGPR